MQTIQQFGEKLIQNVERVIVGKRREITMTLIGLLCQGHVLIEDVPGVGKTMLAKALARSLGCNFSRIQFTPDMLPSDVTGVSVFNQQSRQFEFHAGPIMAQVVLADEINRATPKTQSALLEAMDEQQVTVDGTTYRLARPFIVLATQNPIEYEGTFPLPEAQLDRFFLRIKLGYPSPMEEVTILENQQFSHPVDDLQQIIPVDELLHTQNEVKKVYIDSEIRRYIVDVVTATREHEDVYLGASPRGSLALMRAAQARAGLAGRDYILPDDVKELALPTLGHRIIVGSAARAKDLEPEHVVADALRRVPVPGTTLGATRS